MFVLNLEIFNNYATSSIYTFQLKQSVDINCALASVNGSDLFLSLFCDQTVYFIVMNSVVYNCFLISLTPILKGENKILLKTLLCLSET